MARCWFLLRALGLGEHARVDVLARVFVLLLAGLSSSARAAVAQDNLVSATAAASSLTMTLNVSAASVNNAVTVHVIIFGSCGGSCAASTATINGTAFAAQTNSSFTGLETTHYVSRKSAPTAGTSNMSWVGPSTQWMYRVMELCGTTGGAANRVVFTGPAPVAPPNQCSGAVTLQLQDDAGAPVNGPATLSLSSTDGQMTFYASAGCGGGPVTNVGVAAGTSTATFWFRDPQIGTTTVRASAAGYHSGFQTATIAVVAGSTLAFTTPSRSFTPGVCGRGQRDHGAVAGQRGQPRQRQRPRTSLHGGDQLDGDGGLVHQPWVHHGGDGRCLHPPQRFQSVSLYYSDSQPGSPQVSLTNGSGLANPPAQTHTVLALPASALAFTTAPQTLAPTRCSPTPAAVEARDSAGNSVTSSAPRTVTLTSNSGTLLFFSDAGCTTPMTSAEIPTGASSLSLYFRDPAAGSPTLTANSAGLTPAQQQQLIQPQVLGRTCDASAECASSQCASGVCCQTACAGACRAYNVAGNVGTCAPVANGTACPNGVYCDGQETCQAGSCQASPPVTCVDPFGHDILACQESAQRCERVPNSPPVITHDANLSAGVEQPYIYNVMGAVRVAGDRPMTFSSCGGPGELRVDPLSGAVLWMPVAEGLVPVCVRAENAFGADSYNFTVQVGMPTGSGPVARYLALPDEGRMPLNVTFDGSASSGTMTLVQHGWELFPGMPPMEGVTVQHAYQVPTTYWPRLTVTDTFGRQDSTSQPVTVWGEQGQRPISARIRASALTGEGARRLQL